LKANEHSRQGSTLPDLTIGFCTYNLDTYPWINGHPLADDHRVKLFDRKFLKRLQEHFNIPSLYRHPQRKQALNDSPQFPFVLWEAKSAVAAATHQTASSQTAQDLKTILMWQQEFYRKSGAKTDPLVWYFNNVGADWKIYACHVRDGREISIYVRPL
jgi:hypothetical protein